MSEPALTRSAAKLRFATVVVIGAGQAGLSAAYHLSRRGFASALTARPGQKSFVVLDAEEAAGGAWRHRWDSLTMATVNGIFDLPGLAKPPISAHEPSRIAVPRYFAGFEEKMNLPIIRPVTVTSISDDLSPGGGLMVRSSAGAWRARAIINATGTWTNPVLPDHPGKATFQGRQLHTKDYASLEEFTGQRVAIVGGGISALQHLEEISRVAKTFWYTRREPLFREDGFSEQQGRDAISQVIADVEAGNPTGSVVSYTGLIWSEYAVAAQERGVLNRRPMFTRIEPGGVREADGKFTPVDTILWATGFRPALNHLEPLRLQNERGGVTMVRTQVAADPRIHLVGFGPSQSTVGANRAGREAVHDLVAYLRAGGE